jgi:hypothetical protein
MVDLQQNKHELLLFQLKKYSLLTEIGHKIQDKTNTYLDMKKLKLILSVFVLTFTLVLRGK